MRLAAAAALLAALLPSSAVAQLHSDCNPLEGDKCPPNPAFGTAHEFTFNQSQPTGMFKNEAGLPGFDPDNYGSFAINKQGQSVTYITNFYFFFGRTEVIMKTALGQGIVSSIVWMSDVLDEVDWEFLGGKPNWVLTNYFGKGEQDWHNGGNLTSPTSLQTEWHNYTNIWTKDKLEWWFDGKLIRTLTPEQANKTRNYPQTPMRLSLGIWSGGDPKLNPPGTVEWAGGETDFSKAPFTMYVKSAKVEDYSAGKEYSYGDNSGSWQSIRIATGNSTAYENLNKPPEKTVADKWNELPSSSKTGIYAAAGGVGGIALIAMIWFCIKKRKEGRKEAALAAAKDEEERLEMERWKKEGKNPDALAFDGADASTAAKGSSVSAMYSVPRGPDSPPGSAHGPPTGAWDATSGNGAGSGVAPAGYAPGGMLRQQSFGPSSPSLAPGSPMQAPQNGSYAPVRSQSPGMAPNYPLPGSPSQAPSRVGSPAVQGYGQPNRTFSSGPGVPARSMTASPGGHHNMGAAPPRSMTASPGGYTGGGYGGAPNNGGYQYRG
ncbi:concanavalin A-like lectin/glucanase domain-containing protein [Microdochium trichocladiopsis]|uniref:chitinase n=1 Tax=Microdochium trichocladiopsis TaxID=1682393 RepID=A0A9P9BTM2_9PEZI|nr:concanavalin A-like lectin/glucanase domain-containing protein [Microdochium trichocladiopsis]KAH7037092.1 concanavalin A-like lectin/glucanase domain-containing protein [Microdochium trichocladiopsis]